MEARKFFCRLSSVGIVLGEKTKVVARRQRGCQHVAKYFTWCSRCRKVLKGTEGGILTLEGMSETDCVGGFVQRLRGARQSDQEGGAQGGSLFHSHEAAVVVNYFTGDGEAQTRSV